MDALRAWSNQAVRTFDARGREVGSRQVRSSILGRLLRSDVKLAGALLTFATLLVAPFAAAQPLYAQLRIIAPAAPGGGWDQTARTMQQVLQQAGVVTTPVVENVPGAAGTIGLARFIGAERGNGDTLLVSGLIMLGGIVTHDSPVTLADVVPIARLTGEYEVLTVPTASAFRRWTTSCELQRTARIDLVGRRVGRWQRSDPSRLDRRCRRESNPDASTTSRSRAAAKRWRRFLAARYRSASMGLRSCAADRSGHGARARHLERGAPAGARCTDLARAGSRH